MNVRILELIKHPENITTEDISVLQSEIVKFPYMQSIRTLYLSAIYQFDIENYHKELTKTAAYTTDKKILYHFINFKKETEKKEPAKFKKINLVKETEIPTSSIPETTVEEKIPETEANKIIADAETESLIPNKLVDEISENSVPITEFPERINPEIEKIITEKPAENYTNSAVGDTELETPIIDKKENEFEVFNEQENLELENQTFAELTAKEENQNDIFRTKEDDLNYSKDSVLEHFDQIKETTVTPAEISFNALESFLPDVKFSVPEDKEGFVAQEVTSDKIEETSSQKDINFNQIQEFETIKPESILKEKAIENEEDNQNREETPEPKTASEWKPMSFTQNPLDAHIKTSKQETQKSISPILEKTIIPEAKPVEITPIKEIKQDEIIAEYTSETEEEKPVMNISFFGNKISEMVTDEPVAEIITEEKTEELSSNIPNFVNTWQSWLKINRTETPNSEPVKIIEKKAEIIDKFIEENPKISQLKEDVNYVLKEKVSDISHLMTETLANLYVEQRLYSKAITAYEILKNKHPERQIEFDDKIKEIKELKSNK